VPGLVASKAYIRETVKTRYPEIPMAEAKPETEQAQRLADRIENHRKAIQYLVKQGGEQPQYEGEGGERSHRAVGADARAIREISPVCDGAGRRERVGAGVWRHCRSGASMVRKAKRRLLSCESCERTRRDVEPDRAVDEGQR